MKEKKSLDISDISTTDSLRNSALYESCYSPDSRLTENYDDGGSMPSSREDSLIVTKRKGSDKTDMGGLKISYISKNRLSLSYLSLYDAPNSSEQSRASKLKSW